MGRHWAKRRAGGGGAPAGPTGLAATSVTFTWGGPPVNGQRNFQISWVSDPDPEAWALEVWGDCDFESSILFADEFMGGDRVSSTYTADVNDATFFRARVRSQGTPDGPWVASLCEDIGI